MNLNNKKTIKNKTLQKIVDDSFNLGYNEQMTYDTIESTMMLAIKNYNKKGIDKNICLQLIENCAYQLGAYKKISENMED